MTEFEMARWQGRIDAQLENHERQLVVLNGDIRAIKDLLAVQSADVREILKALKRDENAIDRQGRVEQFRWTKVSVIGAFVTTLLLIIIQIYFTK